MSESPRSYQTSSLPSLPVPANSAPEPLSHAPTLVRGGGDPGGAVVWSPDAKKIRRLGAFWGALGSFQAVLGAGLLLTCCLPAFVSRLNPLIIPLVLPFLFFLFLQIVLGEVKSAGRKRPCYLATDDTGIGVTTMAGTAHFRWDEIIGARYAPEVMILMLRLSNGENRRLNLLGYSKENVDGLLRLISASSELHLAPPQHPGSVHLRNGFVDFCGEVAATSRAREAMAYDWDAPALPKDCKELTPAHKSKGMETLRPDRYRLYLCLLVGIVGAYCWTKLDLPNLWHFANLVGGPGGLLIGYSLVRLFRRPHYCSTNENGIRVSSDSGPCALRWGNVVSLERRCFGLVLGSGESMRVKTYGCKRKEIDALVDRIVNGAQLVPDPALKNRWIRRVECEALAGESALISSHDTGI